MSTRRLLNIVDCHCHAGMGDGLTGPWDTAAPLDAYLRRADDAGIRRSVLCSVFDSDYRQANRRVARIVARAPERFIGFAFVHASRDRGRIGDMVREAVEVHGFRGIKVHRYDAPISREVCEVARRFGLPVLYDVAGQVSQVELLAAEYPEVPWIIPHLGSFADDWQAQRGLIDVMVRHANVITDTAGVRRFDLLEEAVHRAGANKVLFGSDGPWLHPGVELEKVYRLGLPERETALAVGLNTLRLVGLIATGGADTKFGIYGGHVSDSCPKCIAHRRQAR